MVHEKKKWKCTGAGIVLAFKDLVEAATKKFVCPVSATIQDLSGRIEVDAEKDGDEIRAFNGKHVRLEGKFYVVMVAGDTVFLTDEMGAN